MHFNFPIWGMLEKIAVNLMAGVPLCGEAFGIYILFDGGDGKGDH